MWSRNNGHRPLGINRASFPPGRQRLRQSPEEPRTEPAGRAGGRRPSGPCTHPHPGGCSSAPLSHSQRGLTSILKRTLGRRSWLQRRPVHRKVAGQVPRPGALTGGAHSTLLSHINALSLSPSVLSSLSKNTTIKTCPRGRIKTNKV